MAYLNNVRDGRQSKCYLLTFASTAASALTLGKIYAITAVGTATIFGDLKVGDFFICQGTAAPTLGTGDACVEVTPKFLGGATDKDISFEKSTQTITCDKDDAENVTSSGIVAISGSITAYDLLQIGDTAANLIRQRFNKMVTYTAGVPGSAEKDRTTKDVLMFVWDARELDDGEHIGIDFVPAFLSSQGHASAYGSGQTFPVSFTGADTDEAGHRRSYQQIEYFEEFGTQLAAWDNA